jgi:branched-chain amino acid aminotransferase
MIDTGLKIIRTENSKIDQVDFSNLPFGRVFTDHMFVADYENGSWNNMRIEPFANFSIHPANIAWHYGQSIFEGMKATKAVDGTAMLFRPRMHSVRINKSAERLCMPSFPEDSFMEAVYELVKIDSVWIPKEEGSALYLRPYMIAMDEYIGVHVAQRYKFVIFCCPVGPYYSKPISLKADPFYIRAAIGGTGEAKAAGNYAGSLYPAKIARDEGYDQIMWLDAKEHKYIQEVGTMNIFFVIDDTVVTPPTGGTILKGITRDSALTILKDNNYKVDVRDITIDEIMRAGKEGRLKEVFGTGTAAVVANVQKLAYKDDHVSLDLDSYKVSPFLKDKINGIRSKRYEDSYGWTMEVK